MIFLLVFWLGGVTAVGLGLLFIYFNDKYVEVKGEIPVIEELTYLGESICFTEIWYYDGPKMYINKDRNIILMWHDFNDTERYETWFLIPTDDKTFKAFTEGEITALNILENANYSLVKRAYDNYDILQPIEEHLNGK